MSFIGLKQQNRAFAFIFALFLAGCRLGANRSDATQESTANAALIFANCPGSVTFAAQANAALLSKCIACHATGGPGSGEMRLTSGTDDDSIISNYTAAMAKLLEDDGGDYDSNPLLFYPQGNGNHANILSSSDSEYLELSAWLDAEIPGTCTSVVRGGS